MLHTENNTTWFIEPANEGIAPSFELTSPTPLHQEQSPYQTITVYETKRFGNLLVLDDLVMLTTRDNFLYHEMLVHPAIYLHPKPQHIAIIGGGDCGSLKEVLKHRMIKSAIQIEIDECVTHTAKHYFPELCTANNDPRATLLFDDGIAWMKNAPDNILDLILIDSTDPIGPAEGLFQAPFYRDCLRVLREDGILAQQGESPLLHLPLIAKMHDALKKEGFNETAILNFPQPAYPSGWWSFTLASKQPFNIPYPHETVPTDYYNPAILKAALTYPTQIAQTLNVRN